MAVVAAGGRLRGGVLRRDPGEVRDGGLVKNKSVYQAANEVGSAQRRNETSLRRADGRNSRLQHARKGNVEDSCSHGQRNLVASAQERRSQAATPLRRVGAYPRD